MANDMENKPQSEDKAKTSNNNQNRNEPNELEDNAITNILSCQLSRDKSQDLDIRKITFDHPDRKYLISCAESGVKEDIRIYLWSLEKILVGFTDPEDIVLKVEERPFKEKKIANWLLSIDAITTEIKGNKKWIVCAGSIHGDIYVWCGDIDKRKNTWILKDHTFQNFKKDMEKEKAVFDIKIRKDVASNNNTLNIYLALNNIYEISQKPLRDNFIRKLQLEFDESGGKLKLSNSESDFEKRKEWIFSFDLSVKKNILITGSKDKEIRMWDLEKGTSKLIGNHDDAISCVKIFNKGTRVASGCLDNVIKVWDLEGELKDSKKPLRTFTKHKGEIVSLDIQKGDEYLVSASKDNTIKIWDLDNSAMIYDIDVNSAIKKYKNNKKTQATDELEIHGLDFLRQVLISPKNRFIFVVKKNNIIILRNFGKVWHFIQQLEKIEKTGLYENIFGENLKQIAENGEENEEILKDIYKEIIKKREPDVSELGSLFIPAFDFEFRGSRM